MAAGRYNITVEKGATFRLQLAYKDSTGTPFDLTGWIARMQIRAHQRDTTTLVSLTSGGGGITVGTTDGLITVEIAAAVTAAIVPRTGVYDLEVESPTGFVARVLEGSVDFKPEVTRA
jgi:hypothetical protein